MTSPKDPKQLCPGCLHTAARHKRDGGCRSCDCVQSSAPPYFTPPISSSRLGDEDEMTALLDEGWGKQEESNNYRAQAAERLINLIVNERAAAR